MLTTCAVALGVFLVTDVLPGDAALARTRGGADAAELARLREESGLDGPVWERFAMWAWSLLRGDAGTSLLSDRPVTTLIAQRLPATLTLAGCALAVTVPLMLALAWWAGARARRSYAGGVLAASAAVPQVVVAAAAVAVLSGLLGWFPRVSLLPVGASPWSAPEALVLPTLSLALPATAYGAGLLSGVVADVRGRPHVDDAVLRGIGPWHVATRHLLPLLWAPTVRITAVIAGGLVAATTVVETVFGYTGLGELLVSSVAARDVPVVQAVALLGACVVIAGNTAADLVRGGRG
ncbi:ABC transporter permease [Saccharomonospora sp. CUA-673]|uniref:ABC transporter permease n=1 Tax=Saccharomonospora sp. CUA-673 TaxID=1904969 RepID=UPI001C9E39F4|nr:ABC transporter permease [Saccharomonospora sp. CUA-673]